MPGYSINNLIQHCLLSTYCESGIMLTAGYNPEQHSAYLHWSQILAMERRLIKETVTVNNAKCVINEVYSPVKDTESNHESQEKDYQGKIILTCSLKYK